MKGRVRIIDRSQDQQFMQRALELAQQGALLGEVPVGAVLVQQGHIIGEGFNRPIIEHDPSAHAEMLAIRQAARQLQNYRLPDTTLYVTLEPCSMCAGLIVHSRIARVVFAAAEPRAGAAVSQQRFFESLYLNHYVLVEGGVLEEQASRLLTDFFKQRRAQHKKTKPINGS
ncbi:tRNA adenosine(34) deaminase TadA [Pseudomonas sp. F1_0610]|uniref:tRNA adenosine(34) deaminase TadA n=1 Tax=Pseudomonas sp. F1_0610 TaxID=3114284 RepID=UPI0039C14E6C